MKIQDHHALFIVAVGTFTIGFYYSLPVMLALGLVFTGWGLLDVTRVTRGPGSWATDRVLVMLAGACWGAAFATLIIS